MAESTRVEVLGYPELAAGSAMLARRIEDSAGDALTLVAESVAGGVRGAVPHRTGALAGSVSVLGGDESGVSMGAGLRYAGYVEHGGRGHPRSSEGNYLYPVASSAEPLLLAAGQSAARKEIGGMNWPRPT